MGHVRLGNLPRTRAWREVVALISDGADVVSVADATVRASERAFSFVQDDQGFREAVWLMTQLGVAAKKPDPLGHLASLGIGISANTSLADVAAALTDAMDRVMDASGKRSDFGEMAQRALVGAISGFVGDRLPTLLPPTGDDVKGALAQLRKPKEFANLSKDFFAKLTNEFLGYFLSKTLATHLGEGRQFLTMKQMGTFEAALEKHCEEASAIVEDFSGEWFSKHRYEESGDISRKSVEGFGWYALEKMRRELAARAKEHAN